MKKKLCLFSALTLILISSCSSDGGQEGTSVNNSVLLKKIVMKDGTSSNFFEYSYNGNKLTRITPSFSKNSVWDFTYNGDLIQNVKKYDADKSLLFETFYEYDGKQRLISEKTLSKYYDYGDKWVYVYNSDGTISYTKFSGDLISQNQITNTGKIWVNDKGEVLKVEEYINNALSSKSEYTYDDKNNMSRNILGYNKLFLINVVGMTYNILTYKRYDSNNVLSFGYSNKYTYNSSNYPLSRIETTSSGSVTTTEFVY